MNKNCNDCEYYDKNTGVCKIIKCIFGGKK